ncbi:ComEC/Rec2 family competence protein [bacterium]|nr:ComEC/Rec2 family competence protein [bacterium]
MFELMMNAPFFHILAGTLSGVLCSECFAKPPAWLWYFAAALYFLISFLAFFKRRSLPYPLLVFAGAFLGAALHYRAADRPADPREEERYTQCEVCEKAVWSRESEDRKYYASFVAAAREERFKAILYSRVPFSLEKGDVIACQFKYSPLKGAAAPGCFDAKAHYARENIYRSAVAKGNFLIKGPRPESLGKKIDALRDAASRSLSDERFPTASKLLRIMLLGSREKLPPEVERGIKKSGIAHILAVSGLHIGLLSGVWFLLTRLLGLSRLCFKLPLLPLLWLYALFLGDRPSVVRSVILMTFLIGGRIMRKATLSLHFLCAAAFLYALVSPKQIFSYSSLLSYAATAALLIMLPQMDSLFAFKRSAASSFWKRCAVFISDYVVQSLKISLAVLLFSLPLLLSMLHMITPLGFFMNILTIPLCALLLICGLWRMIVFFTPLPLVLSDICWDPVMLLWEKILPFVVSCGEKNLFVMSFPSMSPNLVLYYYLTLLFFLLSEQAVQKYNFCEKEEEERRFRRRDVLLSRALFLRRIFLSLLLVGAAVLLRPFAPSAALRVTALNVGQGDAFVISSDLGPNLVVDCGRSSAVSSQGEQIVAPYLRNRGIGRIDALESPTMTTTTWEAPGISYGR